MAQIFPILPEIAIAAAGDTPDQKIESLVRQLNDQNRLISNSFAAFKNESVISTSEWFGAYKRVDAWVTLPYQTTINFDDWEYHTWYWENVIFTDAGTGYVQLFNVTDNEVVPGTEYTTTTVGEENAEYNRTGPLEKYKGTKVFKVQLRISGGNGTSEYVNCMMSRMVFRIATE
jgi:hypothetical protein